MPSDTEKKTQEAASDIEEETQEVTSDPEIEKRID